MAVLLLVSLSLLGTDPLRPGDHLRKLTVEGRERNYLVHVPPGYDPSQPTPVVLILHGAFTNAAITVLLTGMNSKADDAGFLAVYPNGTGVGPLLFFNAGGRNSPAADRTPNDVQYIATLLDDLAVVANVDRQRVFATGISNGGMMAYRLAAELSDRIAAIAPVAGTMAIEQAAPRRPVSVLHFHGMADTIVPPTGVAPSTPSFLSFKSVAETIRIWCRLNGCSETPVITEEPDRRDDGTRVTRKTYGPGADGAEVVLLEIHGGGHTWPGRNTRLGLIGKATLDISANDLMWEFFQKHPMK